MPVDVPARGVRLEPERGGSLQVLRARWQSASLAAGWRFPSDWALPEVDSVCAALLRDVPPDIAIAGLARARAVAGAGLAETLLDLAALHAVITSPGDAGDLMSPDVDALPSRLLRVAALAWADVAMDKLASTEVIDPLTGLPTAAYLRTRLRELYGRPGHQVAEDHTLLVVSVDLSGVSGWPRLTAMILIAEALRAVFDGGESIASLGPSTAAAVVPRDGRIAGKAVLLRRELHERLSVDDQLEQVGAPKIKLIRLPATHRSACDLLQRLART
ncbi:GGDEF domain-containing protein [Amycolatopsis thermophila]|uniref:GGDEF domain-containing protein n=1 Tax=Amycolatopsis thermophila TaxID=206084 RepID=A0ABU0EQR0_9PSEU|nr:GGDEF domain-containing protein [Amycolatopsis thermophila]